MKSLLTLSILVVATLSYSQERSDEDIQATMIYNFMKYIRWPNETGGNFMIGVYGEDKVFALLKERMDGKSKGQMKYVVKNLGSLTEAGSCNAVYLGKSKNSDFAELKSNVKGKSVLTVTDSPNLGNEGSCVNFRDVDGKLRFEMNEAALDAANLKVSNQLLSMAIH